MTHVLTAAYALFLIWCWKTSAIRYRWRQPQYLRLIIGCTAATLVLWRIQAGIYDGLSLHFLGITVVTLMLGWRSAVCVLSVTQLLLMLATSEQWQSLPALLGLGVLLPVLTAYGWLTLCHNLLPKNLWIYVFVSGFANGAITFVVRTVALGLWYQSQYDWQIIVDNYLILIPLFLVPEAMLNGFTTVLLVVYKPDWLATWSEKQYLTGAGRKE